MTPLLIDTDTLSTLMRGEATPTQHARQYLQSHGRFSLSIITRYEILRGLAAKLAQQQTERFNRFCEACEVLPVDEAVVERAADIYADLRQRGQPIGDADILIAATAISRGYGLVTNNLGHFERIRDLEVTTWNR